MTRKEAERLTRQVDALRQLGFTAEEAEVLRRISTTLHRWHEHECNGTIQRAGDDGDGAPYWYNPNARYLDPHDSRARHFIPDREAGALKRLAKIVAGVNVSRAGKAGKLASYVQGDPRGAALYIIRPGDVPAGADVGGYYSRGICVY